jgi:hypothetical protein
MCIKCLYTVINRFFPLSFIYGLYLLGMLSKLLLDEYLSNVSKDLLSNRKSFLTKRKPNSGTLWRAVVLTPKVSCTALGTWRKMLHMQSTARRAVVRARRL